METDGKKFSRTMKDWDVLFSLVLMASCVALIAYSFKISFDAMGITDAVFYTAPGFAPLLVGSIIFILSAALLAGGIKNGGSLSWIAPAKLVKIYTSKSFRETFLVFFYLCIYMWTFWETIPFTRIRVPFWLGTYIFLFLMLWTFKAAKLNTALLISLIATALIQISFGHFAGIPLP
jgi:hypothetical protein